MSCRQPQAGTVTGEDKRAAAGWREAVAAADPAELLVWTTTSARCPPTWAGGAGSSAKGLSQRMAPCASSGSPHPSSHMSPVSYRTFSSPAWTRGWADPQDEAPPGSLSVHWRSELPAGSVFGGNNQLNPECCPLLTRRFPSQQQEFHRGTGLTAMASHPKGLYTKESGTCRLPCKKTPSPRG